MKKQEYKNLKSAITPNIYKLQFSLLFNHHNKLLEVNIAVPVYIYLAYHIIHLILVGRNSQDRHDVLQLLGV